MYDETFFDTFGISNKKTPKVQESAIAKPNVQRLIVIEVENFTNMYLIFGKEARQLSVAKHLLVSTLKLTFEKSFIKSHAGEFGIQKMLQYNKGKDIIHTHTHATVYLKKRV